MISLQVGTDIVALPADLYWSDEAWASVEAVSERTLTGGLIVQQMTRISGRPITLGSPPDGRGGWMRRAALAQLLIWLDTPGQVMELHLQGSTYDVIWRHQDAPALEWTPLRHRVVPTDNDYIIPVFKFLTREA